MNNNQNKPCRGVATLATRGGEKAFIVIGRSVFQQACHCVSPIRDPLAVTTPPCPQQVSQVKDTGVMRCCRVHLHASVPFEPLVSYL